MTVSKFFFDTSAWLCYFGESSNKVKEIVEEDGQIYTSALSLLELKRKLKKKKVSDVEQKKLLEFLSTRTVWINVNLEIAAKSSEFENLHTVDSIIYASCLITESTLITLDNDFRGLKNVVIINE